MCSHSSSRSVVHTYTCEWKRRCWRWKSAVVCRLGSGVQDAIRLCSPRKCQLRTFLKIQPESIRFWVAGSGLDHSLFFVFPGLIQRSKASDQKPDHAHREKNATSLKKNRLSTPCKLGARHHITARCRDSNTLRLRCHNGCCDKGDSG